MGKGHYMVCGCQRDWIWEDKARKHPKWSCRGCGKPWLVEPKPEFQERSLKKRRTTEWATWNHQRKGQQWPKSYKQALLDTPPGLPGKVKKDKTYRDMEVMAQKHWEHLPEEFRSTLQSMGLGKREDTKPPELADILKEHIDLLPDTIKAQVEKIVKPTVEITPKTEALKLKATAGHLRDLTHKKAQIQTKVDTLKDQYKQALQELQDIQLEVERIQKELKDTTEQYAKLMEDVAQETPEESIVTTEQMFQVIQKAGISFTEEQKIQMQKMAEENAHKKRRTTPGAGTALCG